MPENFLLASSTIIPLLALTLLVELRHYEERASGPGPLVRWAAFLGFVGSALVIADGEWVCLRSLEVGHVTSGFFGERGTSVIWASMAILSALIFLRLTHRLIGIGEP